jgi:hypothetical protein
VLLQQCLTASHLNTAHACYRDNRMGCMCSHILQLSTSHQQCSKNLNPASVALAQ